MLRRLLFALVVSSVAGSAVAGGGKGVLQTATTEPPSELAEPIRKLLPATSVQITDSAGQAVGEFWFRSSLPVDATPTQIKNGLTYREVRQTEIVGAVRFDREFAEYRKQKIKAGVYTLRLGFQPMIGDHIDVSEHKEFLLLTAADKDTTADAVEAKEMIDRSIKTTGTDHPGVMMLFPYAKPGATVELATKPKNHVVLNWRVEPIADEMKTGAWLGFSVTIAGHAP